MEPEKVVIKKYGNRRLYDTTASRYINLDDIAAMVRGGVDLQVVDAKSGEDLTRVTLTQIIVEDAKDQPTGLPLELLRELIVASDHVGREFIMWYVKSAFDAYQKVQKMVHSGISEVHSTAVSPVDMIRNLLQGGGSPLPAKDAESSELDELRRRIAELEARGQKPQAKKKKRAARS